MLRGDPAQHRGHVARGGGGLDGVAREGVVDRVDAEPGLGEAARGPVGLGPVEGAPHEGAAVRPHEGRPGWRGRVVRRPRLRIGGLRGVFVRGARRRDAGLRGARLCRVVPGGADLRGARLCRAGLLGARLCRAHLKGAGLRSGLVPAHRHLGRAHTVRQPGSQPRGGARHGHLGDLHGAVSCVVGAGGRGVILRPTTVTRRPAAMCPSPYPSHIRLRLARLLLPTPTRSRRQL